jgi:transglutaminase-like putative cysteine protease
VNAPHPSLLPRGTVSDFLRSSAVIDWDNPAVLQHARSVASGSRDALDIARRAFEWVRDEIRHSYDHRMNPVTCSASEALAAGTGYCFAKSHLLAALLRANGIPAGLCYQRLSLDGDGPPFSLHGLVGVLLPEHDWYRIDPRGNRPGVDAQFTPPVERLAFDVRVPGEANFRGIWPEPLPRVVQALRTHATYAAVWQALPDVNASDELTSGMGD